MLSLLPSSLSSSQMKRMRLRGGQPLAQSRTACQGCAQPLWNHASLSPLQDTRSLQFWEEDPGLSAALLIQQQTLTQHQLNAWDEPQWPGNCHREWGSTLLQTQIVGTEWQR